MFNRTFIRPSITFSIPIVSNILFTPPVCSFPVSSIILVSTHKRYYSSSFLTFQKMSTSSSITDTTVNLAPLLSACISLCSHAGNTITNIMMMMHHL